MILLSRFLFILVFSAGSFYGHPGLAQDEEMALEVKEKWAVVDKPFSYQNLQVPRKFWSVLNGALKKAGHSSSAIKNFGILPVSVKVELSSDDHVVLKNGINYQINFVEGGGQIDLFDFVAGKGPFKIRMVPDFDFEKDFQLIYISDSPGKKIGQDSWGNACGRMYDLSRVTDRFIADGGMRITGARKHYLHLMAGTFIFFQLIEERLYLGYIKLEDSRYPQFNCKNS